MKHLISFLCIAFVVLFSACQKDEAEKPKNERTVLVYLVANNSLSSFVSDDLAEMKQGISGVDTDRNTLLVFCKDKSTARLFRLVNNNGQAEEEEIATYNDQNSLDVDVMKNIISTAFNAYPADSYGITFWSHGEGWVPSKNLRWWGQDGSNYMDIADLHTALKSAPHLDFLFFDACFMEAAEVAYDLRDCADYLISSPTEIPGPGAPYQTVVPAMFAAQDRAVNIAKAYFTYYEDKYDEGRNISNYNWTGGSCIAVLKMNQLEQLAAATAKVLPKYIQGGETIDVTGIMRYDRRSATKYYYDLDRLIYKLTGGNEEYTQWRAAFDAATIYWKSTPKNFSGLIQGMFTIDPEAGGISTYIPNASAATINSFYQGLAWYKAAGWDQTGW